MKKLLLFAILTTISFTGFSQKSSLKPIVQQINADTLYCFSIPQVKEIAYYIENSRSSDSILFILEKTNRWLGHSLTNREVAVRHLTEKVNNLEMVNKNQLDQQQQYQQLIISQEKKLNQSKWQKRVLCISLGILTFIAIIG